MKKMAVFRCFNVHVTGTPTNQLTLNSYTGYARTHIKRDFEAVDCTNVEADRVREKEREMWSIRLALLMITTFGQSSDFLSEGIALEAPRYTRILFS